MIKCIGCGKYYEYESTDGICPKCGAYNSGTSEDAQNQMRSTEQHTKDNNDIFEENTAPSTHHHGQAVFDELDPKCMAENNAKPTYNQTGYTQSNRARQYAPVNQANNRGGNPAADAKNNKVGILIAGIIIYFALRALFGLF